MKRDISVYIKDILDCIDKIEEYISDVTEEEFYSNSQIQDAVFRRLEVMGEAAKHIPQPFRKIHPNIPWKEIEGLRDVLIHEYFGVNIKRVWKVAHKDIVELRKNIAKLL